MSRPLAGKSAAFTVMVNAASAANLRISILAHTGTPDVFTHAPYANWSTGQLAPNLTLVASGEWRVATSLR
jgi:hypothetical protein